jgi:hypothetical protein
MSLQRGPWGSHSLQRACLGGTGSNMEMDLTLLVGTAQCRGWGTGWTKLMQRARRQRLRRDGTQAVGHRSLKTQDSTSHLKQDLDPGWGVMIWFWLHFLFLPRPIQWLIVYPPCSLLTVRLLTPIMCYLLMTGLRLGHQPQTLYLCWLTDYASAFGLGHIPFPLALGDDPSSCDIWMRTYSSVLLYYWTKPINRLPVDYESLKLDFV